MTTEQLMQPWYKVIADYPGNSNEIGDIFTSQYAGDYNKYPHLFKKLEWWEYLNAEDMPQYVKTRSGKVVRELISVNWGKVYIKIDGKAKIRSTKDWFPATEEEYNEYLATI